MVSRLLSCGKYLDVHMYIFNNVRMDVCSELEEHNMGDRHVGGVFCRTRSVENNRTGDPEQCTEQNRCD